MIRKHVNFIPRELRPRFRIPQAAMPLLLLPLLVAFVTVSAVRMNVATYLSKNELAELEKSDVETSKKVQSLMEQSKLTQQNNDALTSLQKVLSRKSYWSEVFKELSILIPEGIWLTNFTNKKSDKKTELILSGESASQELVARFLSTLEQSHHFAGVRINFSEKEADIKPMRYHFEFALPAAPVAPATPAGARAPAGSPAPGGAK